MGGSPHRLLRQHHVPVGADLARHHLEARVRLAQPGIDVGPARRLTAVQADDPVEVAVQLEHVARARGLVQPVDVLGDDLAHEPQPLQRGHRPVPVVGRGRGEPAPADEAAGPVAATVVGGGDELAVRHRGHPPLAVGAAVVGDPGLGREAGAGEDRDVAAAQELDHGGQPGQSSGTASVVQVSSTAASMRSAADAVAPGAPPARCYPATLRDRFRDVVIGRWRPLAGVCRIPPRWSASSK